ncbi:MAG: hypothetical protein JO316_23290 [Abitibacteriaceae bacterium]|nr:hypothetical protein [Abditibacteriaceae bacterium]
MQNLRDVWRVLNTLEFSLPALVRDEYLDVDLVDFVMLSVLRIHEPNVFALLPLYKAALTGDKKMDIDNQQRNAPEGTPPHPYQVQMETLLQSASVSENPFRLRALHKILKGIFPDAPWPKLLKLSVSIGGKISYEDYISWRESRSHLTIGKEGNFDRYFVFSLNDDTIPETEVQAIIKSQDREFLIGRFKEWEAQNQLHVWIERIYSSISSTNTICSDTFLITWLEIGDISQDHWFFRYSSMTNTPCFVVIKALSNKQTIGQQGKSHEANLWVSSGEISKDFLEIIQKTQGVHLPIQCIELVQWMFEQTRHIRGDKPLVSPDVINECSQICGQRIADMAQQQKLSNHLYVDYLVWFWRQVDESAAQQWIDMLQSDAEQLFKIMRAWSSSFRGSSLERHDLAELLLAIIPLPKIEELLSAYNPVGTDDINAAVVRLIRELLPSIHEFDEQLREQERNRADAVDMSNSPA